MSKKSKPKSSSTKKKSGSRYGRPAPAKRQAKSARAARPRPKGARSQALPGLEQVRDVKLDNLCEGIADTRTQMNAATAEESGLKSAALQRMQARNITVYKHGGVELVRVPGSEKLRVKLTDDEGDASVSAGTTQSDNAEESAGEQPRMELEPGNGEATQH